MPIPSATLLPSATLIPGSYTVPAGLYTHSFPGIRPRARYDENPWLTVTVAESATRTGSYTDLTTATLDPAEIDASTPVARNITVNGATLPAGWYRFTFTDADGETEIFDPLWAGPGIRPSVADVAAKMLDRTTLDGGATIGTFNTETSPTAAQVETNIDDALDIIEPRVPADANPETMRAARAAAVLQAAIFVESSNWSDDVTVNETRVALWERLLETHLNTLDNAAQDNTAGSARFGSITVTSPTLSAQGYGWCTEELVP